MNFIEKKAELESTIEKHREKISEIDALKERLVAEINYVIGQVNLLTELIADGDKDAS